MNHNSSRVRYGRLNTVNTEKHIIATGMDPTIERYLRKYTPEKVSMQHFGCGWDGKRGVNLTWEMVGAVGRGYNLMWETVGTVGRGEKWETVAPDRRSP